MFNCPLSVQYGFPRMLVTNLRIQLCHGLLDTFRLWVPIHLRRVGSAHWKAFRVVLQRSQSIYLVWEDLGILRDAHHGEHFCEVL